jgi:protein required for attachment to host cells
MSKLKIGQGEWVVVCDGAKALVLENAGDDKFPNLKTREVYEEPHPATRDQGTDAPGRAHSSVGAMRSSMGQTDWHDQDERRFLAGLMTHLDAAVTAGQLKSMVMVAPPRALGVIRQSYSPQLKNVLREEIDKDLVKLPVHEIEKHLAG